MATLYEISQDIIDIFNIIESNDGEITDEMYNDLCIKQEDLKYKLDGYVKAIKEFEADADLCKKEKQRIADRQNIYKNRVEKLKEALLTAVENFGEEGKSNKFIECPTYRVFTRKSKSIEFDENRIRILINEFNRYVCELYSNGVLYVGEDVDILGILDAINANVKAEQGDTFIPFTIHDLFNIKLNIKFNYSIYDLFSKNENVLKSIATSFNYTIENGTDKSNIKYIFADDKFNEENKITFAEQITKNTLQIK